MSRLYFFGVLFALPIASAQEATSGVPSLTLQQAVIRTLEENPRFRAVPFIRDAANADIEQAGLTPQWSVDLKIEDFAGTGDLSGFGASETTLQLSRVFQSSDVRTGRMSVASAQASQLDSELASERLDTMTLLARRFLAVVRQQEMLMLARQAVGVWERAGQLAEQRERAGGAPAVDRLRTEIQLANARLQQEHAEHELKASREALAATWG
ncbi:MAG: TolC family protein, partial [Woeseiaceae bacterium]